MARSQQAIDEGKELIRWLVFGCCGLVAAYVHAHVHAQEVNLNHLPNRISVPPVVAGQPAAGRRVWQKLEGNDYQELAHALYLPEDWESGKTYPVIFEYPGNGGFKNALGDSSDGTIEGCRMGFGLTEGRQAIWVCLPFVDKQTRQHALNWWGDADETVKYCKQTVALICERWGGDRQRLVLCGFSRGAIATSYIGLRDDEIASLWLGLIAHSHYDGVRRWPYRDSDRDAAAKRLQRFAGKPQWISHESSISETTEFLQKTGLMHERLKLVSLPYANHSADWLLKDLEVTHQARQWWQQLIMQVP